MGVLDIFFYIFIVKGECMMECEWRVYWIFINFTGRVRVKCMIV